MSESETDIYDVAIIGGGFAGISLACALAQLGDKPLKIALLEAADYQQQPPPSFDSRTLALSYSSRQIFSALGLWSDIEDSAITPIKTIHISDRGHPGIAHLYAHEQNVQALGYVIESWALGRSLFKVLQQHPQINLISSAQVEDVTTYIHHANIKYTQDNSVAKVSAKLVVAADGSQSSIRRLFQVKTWQWDYHQHAVISNIAVAGPHQNIAYERFTHSGPMALLPLGPGDDSAHRYGLVWTVAEQHSQALLDLDDAQFIRRLQQHFGQRAGEIVRVGQRHAYALGFLQSREHVRPRLAFVGNAAHTLHPVAGQGFNLGLRDVAVLAQVIRDACEAGKDIGDLAVLSQYARWRRRDQIQTSLFTDSLVRIFSSDFFPLVMARNLGLTAMDLFAPLRRKLTRHAMGYLGKSSLLARGIGL